MFKNDISIIKTLEIKERLQVLRGIVSTLKPLVNRVSCPCCKQSIDSESINSEFVIFSALLKSAEEEFKTGWKAGEETRKAQMRERQARERKEEKEIELFTEENISLMRKAIREYRKGSENFLPCLSTDKQKLWNKSIDKFIGDRASYDDLDEFEFHY